MFDVPDDRMGWGERFARFGARFFGDAGDSPDVWSLESADAMQELLRRCTTDSPAGAVRLSERTTIFLPENYEPGYAYPMIVWVSEHGLEPLRLLNNTPLVSTRNYLATCVTVDRPGSGASPLDEVADLAESVESSVAEVTEEYNIHPRRIHLVGFDEAATLSLELLLTRAEWFAGAYLVGASLPRVRIPVARYRHLRGKRVVLAVRDARCAGASSELARLLRAAGIDVQTVCHPTRNRVAPKMLQHINHWIMEGICSGGTRQ